MAGLLQDNELIVFVCYVVTNIPRFLQDNEVIVKIYISINDMKINLVIQNF